MNTYIHIYTYICMCTCTYLYIYICMYAYIYFTCMYLEMCDSCVADCRYDSMLTNTDIQI